MASKLKIRKGRQTMPKLKNAKVSNNLQNNTHVDVNISENGKFCLSFERVDLYALYAIMSMKRIVLDSHLVRQWQAELDEIVNELKESLKKFQTDEIKYFFYTLRDFTRVYGNKWVDTETDFQEEDCPSIFETLMLVLALRLGLQQIWKPNFTTFFELILIDHFLNHKPKLELTFLNQVDPFYEILLPLCDKLSHVVLPMCDNTFFLNISNIKSLKVLEFSSGVSDKVLCQALWNTDKKSEYLLQTIIKVKGGNHDPIPVLPHLEILKSNIQKYKTNSMKITVGAVALILQPKLRLVQNETNWSTFEAINCITEMEKRFVTSNKRKLPAVKQLRIKHYLDKRELVEQLDKVFEMCPSVHQLILSHCPNRLKKDVIPYLQNSHRDRFDWLALDFTEFDSVKDFVEILSSFKNLKSLTLKLSLSFLRNFSLRGGCAEEGIIPSPTEFPINLPHLKMLSLVVVPHNDASETQELVEDNFSSSMISFLYRFSSINDLKFYNTLELPACFVAFGCIAGALAVMNNLKHLSIVGSNLHFPTDPPYFRDLKKERELSGLIETLLDNSTFSMLRKLKMFTIDELYVDKNVDNFLEVLRTVDVQVRIIIRPTYIKNKMVEKQTRKFHRNILSVELTTCALDMMDFDLDEDSLVYW